MTHVPMMFCFCGSEMRNVDTGVTVEVQLKDGTPYFKIQSDVWACWKCDSRVFRNAHEPRLHRHEAGFLVLESQYTVVLR